LQLQKYDLQTKSKEILLSRQYKIALQIKDLKKGTVNNLGKIIPNKELTRVLGLASGDQMLLLVRRGLDSRKQLIEANIGLVNYICNYYRYRGVAYPNLVQVGTLGLIKAVDKYDPERGCRFSTFAFWWIRQSVSGAIAEKSRLVRFPCHIHELMVSLGRSKKLFVSQNSRELSLQELAECLALPLHMVRFFLRVFHDDIVIILGSLTKHSKKNYALCNRILQVELLIKCSQMRTPLLSSFDSTQYGDPISEDQFNPGRKFSDLLVSQNEQLTSSNERSSIRSECRRAIYDLPKREAQILDMRFGFSGEGHKMTLAEIGRKFGVSRERIRQIEAIAIKKLREGHADAFSKEMLRD
jgi:RNA polymerase sigma factor (sigma-70 family)